MDIAVAQNGSGVYHILQKSRSGLDQSICYSWFTIRDKNKIQGVSESLFIDQIVFSLAFGRRMCFHCFHRYRKIVKERTG